MNNPSSCRVNMLDERLTRVIKTPNEETVMSFDRPESLLEQLLIVRQHQADLRKLASPRPEPRPARELSLGPHRFAGIHLHVGSLVVAVGRTLYDEEAQQSRPLSSRPLGS
jgi:hypothetical protein